MFARSEIHSFYNKIKTYKNKKTVKTVKRLKKSNNTYINYHKTFAENKKQFYIYLRYSERREEMSTALNENREYLLHLMCQFNEANYIQELIKLKCPVFKQDFYGRTPLHVAIQQKHRECIDEFVIILNLMIDANSNKDNADKWKFVDNKDKKELVESLRIMFRVYDNDGYTVLHLAILKNLRDVVQTMLKFCIKFEINVLENEVLGSGDSILHLAVKNNFKDIARNIIAAVKESKNYPNYSGSLPFDVEKTDLYDLK